MRIIEGTGFHGLSGIRLKKRGIIRPLLFASRKEIEEYIKEKGVAYRHDNSNLDLRFKRNRIRHKLIPFVSNEFNRLNLNQFLNLSLIFQEWEDYSKKILDHILSKLFVDDVQKIIKLDKRDYQNYFSGIQIKLLEYISSQLSAKKVVLSFNKFRDFNNWLNEHREGKYYRIIPEVVVREHRDNITFQCRNPESLTVLRVIKNAGKVIVSEMGFEIILTIVNKEEVKFTNNPLIEFVDGEKSNFPVILRTWKAGDRFKPFGMKKNRLVSDFLTDLRLDYLNKKSTLLLEKEDKIVAIPGIRVSNDFRVTNTSKKVLKIEVKNIDESG